MNFGPETSEADSFRIMDRALEHAINFFDTANVYGWKVGEGITEQIIGRWFAQGFGRREKVVLATKVYGRMGEWPNQARLSALHIKRACEDSLRRLRTDYVDLYRMQQFRRLAHRPGARDRKEPPRHGLGLRAKSLQFAGPHDRVGSHSGVRSLWRGVDSIQSAGRRFACRRVRTHNGRAAGIGRPPQGSRATSPQGRSL